MFIESARPATIEQAIERTEREAQDAWAEWGIRSWSQVCSGKGCYQKAMLASEAEDRLSLLRDVYQRARRVHD